MARSRRAAFFWTLGGNQVGKAAITGWRDVLAPALQGGGSASPFNVSLLSLLVPGNAVIAETYPAECYGWFDGALGSKGDQNERKKFGAEKARLSLGQNVG